MKKIVITGGGGRIGRALRGGLQRNDRLIRAVDLVDLAPMSKTEEVLRGDLKDRAFAEIAMEGMDVLVHLAAIPEERSWDEIFPNNFEITHSVFEAAHKAGIRKFVYASSIQAVGFHPISTVIDETARLRPSGLYGVSKGFGELLGSLYADRHAISFAALRIASFEDAPEDPRMLKTWLSPRDAVSLFDRCIDAEHRHFYVAYGVSDNKRAMVDNAHVRWLGWQPQDDAESYREAVETTAHSLTEIGALTHGGNYCGIDNTDTGHRFLDN